MSHSPLISVVMPVYNTAAYVGEAIESILGQTLTDLELIIVDDGSTDGSDLILRRYAISDERITVLTQPNSGISAARNAGMKKARGEYIAVMDSDDVALPQRLDRQSAFLESRPDIGICAARCSFFGDGGRYPDTSPPTDAETIKCRMLFTPTITHCSILVRREPIAAHDLYYDTSFITTGDYEMYTRYLRHYGICAIPEVLLRVRTHRASTTKRVADQQHYRNLTRVHRRMLSMLGIEPTEEELDAHLSMCTRAFPRDAKTIEVVERWLLKLLETNARTAYGDQDALARVLLDRWCESCAYMRAPLITRWRRFRRSPLQGLMSDGCASIADFARASISSVLEASTLGRGLKRAIRRIPALRGATA